MEKRYYRPENVRPEHAAQVLEFLNAARTAEEIAEAVEIPGEPDVGLILGRRLLDRRDELGGFTDLAQVRAVSRIGPERFTEIVASLSDAPLPWSTPASNEDVLAEIRALRRDLAARGDAVADRPHVSVRALQPESYLGAIVDLTVQVTAPGGRRPIPDADVTLVGTGGRLRGLDGTVIRSGRSLTVRTDGLGMARLKLLPELTEPLLPAQEAALQAALRTLPAVDTPREARDALAALAREYRWHGYVDLRAAIDVYFRDYGDGLLETVNARDYYAAWHYEEVTVVAFLRDDRRSGADPSAVEASAALTLHMRNWLAPWLEEMEAQAAGDGHLTEDLKRAAGSEAASSVMPLVYTGVHDFLSEQRGVVGEYVGRRVAERSVREFAQSGIESLPVDWQTAVLPALSVALSTVTAGGTPLVSVLRDTRTAIDRELGDRILVSVEAVAGLVNDLQVAMAEVQGELDGKVDVNELSAFRNEVDTRLDAKVDDVELQRLREEVTTGLQDVVTTDALNRVEEGLRADLAGKADRSVVQDLSRSVTSEVGTLRNSVARMDRDILDLRGGL